MHLNINIVYVALYPLKILALQLFKLFADYLNFLSSTFKVLITAS